MICAPTVQPDFLVMTNRVNRSSRTFCYTSQHLYAFNFSYRDLLDRWRMWFYRVDFDNYYSSRIVNQFVHGAMSTTQSSRTAPTTPVSPEGAFLAAKTETGETDHDARVARPAPGVRGVGLPAAANQVEDGRSVAWRDSSSSFFNQFTFS